MLGMIYEESSYLHPRSEYRRLRSVTALCAEDFILTLGAYGLWAAYHFQWLSYGVFQLAMFLYLIRVFVVRHEKSHHSRGQTHGLWPQISRLFWIFHTPYQEPFVEKRRKHVTHHRSHFEGPWYANPHALLDSSPWYRAVLSAIFYEEVMFWADYKFHGGLSRDRKLMMGLSTAALLGLWAVAGGASVLALFCAYRTGMALAWFTFSYVLHRDFFYRRPWGASIPRPFCRLFDALLGSGASTALLFHRFHHEHPMLFWRPDLDTEATREASCLSLKINEELSYW